MAPNFFNHRILQRKMTISVIFLQICFYESRDSLGQIFLHPKLEVLHPIWGPLWIINFMYPYKSDPFIEANLRNKTLSLTYTIKSKLTLSCKIIFRAQAISLCSSNSACLQVYCWKLQSPWTYGDDTILIFVNTICSQYSPRTSWACSNTLTILFAELILGFV